ncbi:FAD-dependent oxidoreductase [Alloiococcus sp. CFN-8]|uniref:FAD-dependent oxidoreductase n=1 Tax=Alloiococcus sp. CFN-8 TaxID=3416081 RepID=UPI003CE67524
MYFALDNNLTINYNDVKYVNKCIADKLQIYKKEIEWMMIVSMKKILVKVDDYIIEANEGESILEAALEAGIYIPHLCYHPDLSSQGGCNLCVVEIQGKEGRYKACETKAEEGMVIRTKTEGLDKLRMVALELMLASHPKDCTSCDKYLNCELQAIMQYMGVAHSRMREIYKNNTDISVSDNLIKKEMQRCIQCGRCIRACRELRGVGVLTFNSRDGETYVGTVEDKPLFETDCRLCGACVEVCPTGAIQDVKGIFPKSSPRAMALIPCKDKCPAHTDIPTYVRLVKEEKYSEAVAVIREKLTFPHSLGYICTHICESGCKRSYVNSPIAIREIKKFAVENDKKESWREGAFHHSSTGRRVAVIGAGPSGMTSAYYLAKKGHEVTIFERQPLAGGMLSHGIPRYRLPREIVNKEISTILAEGITLKTERNINSIEDIKKEGYDAILVAIGAQKGKRPAPFNRSFYNAYDAVNFLREEAKGSKPYLGDTVTVYGGGNVAFDCARTAKRHGASIVRVLCLEAREDMLADKEEIVSALEEGIEILNSRSIREIEAEEGNIKALKVVSVTSFSFGYKGLQIEADEASLNSLNTDTMIFATGQETDLDESFGLELYRGSFIKVDENMETSESGIFSTGDVVYGTKSVVEAIESGRKAARAIDRYLQGDGDIDETLYDRGKSNGNIGVINGFSSLNRIEPFCCTEDSKKESVRCLQCDLRLDIQKVKYWVDPHYKKVKEANI